MIGNYFWGGAAAPYEIEQSLRFNSADSAYLDRSVSTNGNGRTFTISLWFKKGKSSRRHAFYGAGNTANPSVGGLWFRIDSQERLWVQGGGGTTINVSSDDLFRDHSAWYHLVLAIDTTQATSSNRVKMYVNGRQISSFNQTLYPTQNYQFVVNTTSATQQIGRAEDNGSFTYHVDGYVAEYNLIDGTQAAATDFGEFDNNGVWRPIEYTGSYGTNGFYLTFDPSATNGIGHDHSGNGNNWSPSGFTTSGTGTDVMSDTPTTNWCTLNPAIRPYTVTAVETLSEGNLQVSNTGSGVTGSGWGTFNVTSGKWYYEATVTAAGGNIWIGWSNDATKAALGTYTAPLRDYGYTYKKDGNKCNNSSTGTSYGASYTTNDVIGVALDIDGGTLEFFKNGTSQGTAFTGVTATGGFIPGVSVDPGTTTVVANFGQRAFAYTPPTGFKPLNTANLPAPTVKDGSKNFNTVLWTGNGSSQSITGVGFQPDLVWGKSRNDTYNHALEDSVRGVSRWLGSNSTIAETYTPGAEVTSFDTDGFSLGTGGIYNASSTTYVGWNWKAGGTASSNTSGSITSTVSANPTAGFSIITYTGNGTSGATVGHGLGVAPSMVIFKNRDGGEWVVYNKVIGATKNLILSAINRAGTYSGWFNDTEPTSTVLSLGSEADVNRLNDDIVAYCFAEVEGYNKFGSYTGNGSASDGPFVYCGLKPAMVIIKNITTNSNWIIRDSARSTYNPVSPSLYPNLGNAEINNFPMDFLSNGFKIRDDNGVFNTSGDDYIFMCFAENPFGGSGVSPATAR